MVKMNRELHLSRAKRSDNGEFIAGYYQYTKRDDPEDRRMIDAILPEVGEAVEVVPETVGRCVGIQDEHGVMMFEGDIVKRTMADDGCDIGVIVWLDTGPLGFMLKVKKYLYPLKKYGGGYFEEIIGNVQSNPELLGGAE
jgi:hypothetical protein